MSNESVRADWQSRFGRPEPKIICVGLNYHEHAAEGGRDLPPAPLLFGKFASTLAGDGDAIVLPEGIGHVDAEAELAIVIGETAKGVAKADALKVVAGYTCANDVSARDAQFGDVQWFRGKGFDTFCPVGPWIETDFDPTDVFVRCLVDGATKQDGRTAQMMFDVPTLIAYISRAFTLEPGDLIATGTPEGVGLMPAGSRVTVAIEKLGELTVGVVPPQG
jgi:2-keto-4-pentenoate hydratase/2-oxohepta-3-ene-1,7-dioic acid hydratase in catechol pathway